MDSRVVLAALLVAALGAGARPAEAYRHHTSKIHYQEYSLAVFDEARTRGKPVFLLISARWCYWCKYFDEHTLETDEVSGYLNRHYVSVFVDSDVRGDLTRKYARGWPMTVLRDPAGRVRLSFPGALRKEDFLDILRRVAAEVRGGAPAAKPAERLPAAPPPEPVGGESYRDLLAALVRAVEERADPVYGGFGAGRKFPQPRLLGYLLGRPELLREPEVRASLSLTLGGVLRGLSDPVEGGFFRYAERRDWSEPHTEKMLYVNASLAATFQAAARVLGDHRFARAADAAAAYTLRTLGDGEAGGFYGSQSADPAHYRLGAAERRGRPDPPVNRDKVTAWNAEAVLALLALTQRGARDDLRRAAQGALDFMLARLVTDRGVYHVYQRALGRGALRGQLEANAWAALALLEGFRASSRTAYLAAAERILGYALAELWAPEHGAFVERNDPDDPSALARSGEVPLDANGVMAEALLAARALTGRRHYADRAHRVLAALSPVARAALGDDSQASDARFDDVVLLLRAYGRLVDPPAR